MADPIPGTGNCRLYCQLNIKFILNHLNWVQISQIFTCLLPYFPSVSYDKCLKPIINWQVFSTKKSETEKISQAHKILAAIAKIS